MKINLRKTDRKSTKNISQRKLGEREQAKNGTAKDTVNPDKACKATSNAAGGAGYSSHLPVKPEAVKVKFANHTVRGVKMLDRSGNHLKTISHTHAQLIKKAKNVFFMYYPASKRLERQENNQFLLIPYLVQLSEMYNSSLFLLSPPGKVYRNIVFDKGIDGDVEISFTVTLEYPGNAYTIAISRPAFKNLVAEARENRRFVGDVYTNITDDEANDILYNMKVEHTN